MENIKAALEPIFNKLPSVAGPKEHVSFKNKLLWTIGVLALYFILANIPLFGLDPASIDLFGAHRALFAGAFGTLMVLGIGPIVTASLVLQLLVGADIIKLNMSDPNDQAFFHGLQKTMVFVMIIVTALPQVLGGFISADPALASAMGISTSVLTLIIILQMVIGGVFILFMDETISKWGIGSGIGLFIVAGVSQMIVSGVINWQIVDGIHVGLIPRWIHIFQTETLGWLLSGDGLIFSLITGGLLALVTTILIFMLVVHAESTRIEIPLSHGTARGARGRFPVKLIYASVLPMILVRALQANVQMVGMILYGRGITILGNFHGTTPVDGIMYYLSPIHSPHDWIPFLVEQRFLELGVAVPSMFDIGLRVFMDAFFLIGGGIIFALFWIETTGMGAKPTAQKIFNSGMQIPGFRRNIGSIEKVMDRYIPKVTIIGGAFVGLLTLVASLLGTIGGAGGTGLLLTVGIIYKLYEEIASEQMMEMHPMMRSFFGKE